MRKTNVVKTLGIVLLLCIFSLICSNKVQAAEATLIAEGCKLRDKMKISVNFSNDVVGYEGDINITYSNGVNEYLTKIAGNSNSWVGNYSEEFTSKYAGTATVTVNNLKLYDLNSMNNITYDPVAGGSNFVPVKTISTLVATITISDPATQTQPPATTTNSESSAAPEAPANNQPAAPVVLNFKENNETMYTNRRVNVRQNYGTDSNIIQTLAVGTEVIRTGISDGNKDGYSWSRISYNGITGYVITAALTSDAPVTEETPPEEPTEEQPEENPNEVSDENKTEIEKISEELGAIPEVGINIMPFMFLGSCIACMTLIIETKRKLNEQ